MRNGPAVLRNNVLTSPGSHGAQMRAGGVLENNLFIDCPTAAFVTQNSSAVRNNVVLYSMEANGGDNWADGMGLLAFDLKDLEFNDNLVAHDKTDTSTGYAVSIKDGVDNASVRGNVVFNWTHRSGKVTIVEAKQEQVTGNLWEPEASKLIDPTRDAGRYAEHRGVSGGQQAFLDRLTNRQRGQWDEAWTAPAANAWIRQGYEPAPFD